MALSTPEFLARHNAFEARALDARYAREARAALLVAAARAGRDVSGASALDLFAAIERAGDDMRALDRRDPEARALFTARRRLRAAVGA